MGWNYITSQRAFVPSHVSHFEIRKMSNCCHIPSLLCSSMQMSHAASHLWALFTVVLAASSKEDCTPTWYKRAMFHVKIPMNTSSRYVFIGIFTWNFRGTLHFCTIACHFIVVTVHVSHPMGWNYVSSQRVFVPSRVSHFELRKMSNCCHIPSLLCCSMQMFPVASHCEFCLLWSFWANSKEDCTLAWYKRAKFHVKIPMNTYL